MHRRALYALVLGAFLARLLLPAFHHHDEGGRGGEFQHHAGGRLPGPVAEKAVPQCAICELLAVKAPGLVPEPYTAVEAYRPVVRVHAPASPAEPRPARLSLVGAPRGPPSSSPA